MRLAGGIVLQVVGEARRRNCNPAMQLGRDLVLQHLQGPTLLRILLGVLAAQRPMTRWCTT
jgi:hypothetical protein